MVKVAQQVAKKKKNTTAGNQKHGNFLKIRLCESARIFAGEQLTSKGQKKGKCIIIIYIHQIRA